MFEDYSEVKADQSKFPNVRVQDFMRRIEPWADAVDFMVHQLNTMAKELRMHYTANDVSEEAAA